MLFKGLPGLIVELLAGVAVIAGVVALGLYWSRLFEAVLTLVAILQFKLACRQHWLISYMMSPHSLFTPRNMPITRFT